MWMNALRVTEDAVNMQLVPTYLTASLVPVTLDTPVMVSPAQVRHSFHQRNWFVHDLPAVRLYLMTFRQILLRQRRIM